MAARGRVVRACLDRHHDLGVQAHRAVGEVGRADAEQPVVDDRELAVDVDGGSGAVLGLDLGVEHPQPVRAERRAQPADEARAADVHHRRLEHALAARRSHDHHLERRGGARLLRQQNGQMIDNEVLAFQVKGALGRGEGALEEPVDLPHRTRRRPDRPGARHRHLDVTQPGRHRDGPGRRRVLHRARGRHRLVGGEPPALARQRLEIGRDRAFQHQHQVVEGRSALPGCGRAAGLVGPVGGEIPAAAGEVDAADEGEPHVDDHELLVLAGAGRVAVVEAEAHPRAGAQPEAPLRQELAVEAVEQDPVPDQQPDLELRLGGGELVQEPVERRTAAIRLQHQIGVDVPA